MFSIAPTEVKIRPFQGGGVSQSEQVVDFVEHIGSPSEQRQLSAESTEAALALQGQQSEPINNSTRSDRPPLLPSSERRKPTFHIVTPPNELVEYAQACSAKCLAPGFFDDAAKSGPMGRTRDAYDSVGSTRASSSKRVCALSFVSDLALSPFSSRPCLTHCATPANSLWPTSFTTASRL